MATQKWHFATASPPVDAPEKIFNDYADSLEKDTGGLILGQVVERLQETREPSGSILTSVVYALYLVVPRLRNYSYRLLELERASWVQDYPVRLRLFLTSGMHEETADNPADLDQKLTTASDDSTNLLTALRSQVEIREEYSPNE